jgi:hypothetical protein
LHFHLWKTEFNFPEGIEFNFPEGIELNFPEGTEFPTEKHNKTFRNGQNSQRMMLRR